MEDTDYGLSRSDWHPLDTGLAANECVVTIGDVHGCSAQLGLLLGSCEGWIAGYERTTLVFLGDLIDRGPDSLGALDLAINAASLRFDRIINLMGNHEQMLRVAIRGWFTNRMSCTPMQLWRMNGADSLLAGLPAPLDMSGDPVEVGKRLATLLGESRQQHLECLQSHHATGNLLFVHAGIHPYVGVDEFLHLPWDLVEDLHWCWIREPFLHQPVQVPGLHVVHGHTPVMEDVLPGLEPHTRLQGKINLDSFSFHSGRVVAAEFTSTGYRINCAHPVLRVS